MWARVWAVLVLVAGQVRATLDLYVDAEDVKQLLGEWAVGGLRGSAGSVGGRGCDGRVHAIEVAGKWKDVGAS